MEEVTLDTLMRVAQARQVPLSRERAAAILDQVNGLFVFTRELDACVRPDTPPATVFDAQ